ncbi:hypothetical protein ASG56_14115 [Rhodococcus sp. Leaf7]|nr:hypothetical protein ASG56_14115 [Rhodococcus sp. Leaf7]KQU40658.1 hypothetical protein ASG64_14105 [Rhodococcus sp. Leaf247]
MLASARTVHVVNIIVLNLHCWGIKKDRGYCADHLRFSVSRLCQNDLDGRQTDISIRAIV